MKNKEDINLKDLFTPEAFGDETFMSRILDTYSEDLNTSKQLVLAVFVEEYIYTNYKYIVYKNNEVNFETQDIELAVYIYNSI